MLRIQVQGNTLAYYHQGKGETVLFVHGITTYSFIWRNIIPYFTDKYEVIVIDLLGCGDSDIPLEQDFSLKRQTHMLKEFCDQLGIVKMHLVCHDVGGGIGQIFAVHYPEYLHTLTLINTVAYNFWPVQPIVTMRTPVIRQLAMASLDLGMLELIIKRGLYVKSHMTKQLLSDFEKPLKTSLGRKGFLHFAKCLNNKNLTELEEDLRQLKVPVLIIRGEGDVYLSGSISKVLHEQIKGSVLVRIKNGGHFIQEDVPEELSRTILEFIR